MRQIFQAINNSDSVKLKAIFDEHPEKKFEVTPLGSWLHYCASRGDTELTKFFLDQGLDVNEVNARTKGNALDAAASSGDFETFILILKRNPDFSDDDTLGNPLFSAIYSGNIEIVDEILKLDIDPMKEYSGQSMVKMNSIAFALERGQREIANRIASKGATIKEINKEELLAQAEELMILNNK